MTIIHRLPFALLACALATPAVAQTEGLLLNGVLRRGQTVEVIDDQGRETYGRIRALSSAVVTLERDGESTDVPFDRIAQISRPHDTLANGAWIGLGAGAAFGLLAGTVGSSCEADYYLGCPNEAQWAVASTLVMGAIGAGVGVAIDAMIHRERVIYRRDAHRQTRVAPVLGPASVGATVAVSW